MHDSATDRNHSRKRFGGACARGAVLDCWGCRLRFLPSETPDHQNSALTFNHVRASHEIRDGNMHFAPCALPHVVSKDAVNSTPRFPGHEVKHTVAICMASCNPILEPAGADPEVRRRVVDFRAQHGTVIINRGQIASHNDFILAWLFVDNEAKQAIAPASEHWWQFSPRARHGIANTHARSAIRFVETKHEQPARDCDVWDVEREKWEWDVVPLVLFRYVCGYHAVAPVRENENPGVPWRVSPTHFNEVPWVDHVVPCAADSAEFEETWER